MQKKIVIIEDDKDINELVQYNLKQEGYTVKGVFDGMAGLELANKELPDLIILDLMLPKLDGLEVFRILKQDAKTQNIPVLMLSAKSEESDVLVGLQMGAEDYMTKPFSPKILLAKIKTILRRLTTPETTSTQQIREFGQLTIDLLKHKIIFKRNEITLTTLEFNILEFLSRYPGRVFTRDQILDNVWKEGKYIVDRAVDVHVRGLRKKLGNDGAKWVETVHGMGYRFKEIN